MTNAPTLTPAGEATPGPSSRPTPQVATSGPSLFRRIFMCPTGFCHTFASESDNDGCWGECRICHRRAGYVSRDSLRRYMEREDALALAQGAAPAGGEGSK